MKTQLFIGAALFAVASIYAQAPAKKYQGLDEISWNKYGRKGMVAHDPVQQAATSAPSTVSAPKAAARQSKAAAFNWVRLTSSMNVFGVLLSDSKQLTYNEDLDAICLIARRGPGYVAAPNYSNIVGAYSGGIIAFVSKDDGMTWDSTIVWNNDTYWARYPQGGFWNPITPSVNTNVDNAYVVVTGPITPANGGPPVWTGNYFASKSLSVFTNVADPQPGAQIYNENSNPNPMFNKVDMARTDFQYTDDGKIHVAGNVYHDYSLQTQVFRGIRLLTGNFNSGVFTWAHDSIMLHQSSVNFSVNASSITYFPMVYGGISNMAWSENGQIGYAWFVGQRKNSTQRNSGLQPIVWRTTDAGQSWSELPGINFNDTVKFAPVLKTVDFVWDTLGNAQSPYLQIPHFGPGVFEDIGSIVDKNGNLHLTSLVGSTAYDQYKYAAVAQEYTNVVGDGQIYSWSHLGDNIPIIFDFVFNSTSNDWNFCVVDTLRTEGPTTLGTAPLGYGFSYNKWLPESSKQQCNARIQLSRSADGQYIFYTWVDTDPNFTQDAVRWNVAPDLYVRMRHADSTSMHLMKYDLTGSPLSPDVFSAAYMHHTSTKVKMVGVPTPYNVTVKLPVKVTNSIPLNSEQPNTTHFLNAQLSFTATAPQPTIDTTPLSENMISAASSVLFPNPTSNNAFLVIDLPHANDVNVTITNIVGQQVMTRSLKGNAGFNQFEVKTEGLSAGVYMVNVRVADGVATKKLVIE